MENSSLENKIDNSLRLQMIANKDIRSLKYRKALIQKLLDWMTLNENLIKKTISKDFNKPELEIDLTEIWVCIKEAKYILKNLKTWMAKEKVSKTLPLLTTSSYIIRQPKGIVFIIAPWNYPFQLSVMPLLAAIASGNSVFLKPSEKTPNTSQLIKDMVSSLFEPQDVVVFEGGEEVVTPLLKKKFDHIFYTGGTDVGRIVMKKAAEQLTPVTLELGGKCPVLIDETANISEAADKISYFKFMNSGQTCVAPDYALVHEKIYEDFLAKIKKSILNLYGPTDNIKDNNDYGRSVNQNHAKRLIGAINESLKLGDEIDYGADFDESACFISPTIIRSNFESFIMKEEIFGPVLPVIKYSGFDGAIASINKLESPLASYIFSKNKMNIGEFTEKTKSGAVCINDMSLHLIHDKLPFGGVGSSGIGRYHGKFGFDELSNIRPVIQNIDKSPLKILYPPYSEKVKKITKILKKMI